jgi:hypothetical protein
MPASSSSSFFYFAVLGFEPWLVLLELTYRFDAISIQIPAGLCFRN